MILHILPYEKFTGDYIKKINVLFDKNEHLYYVYGKSELDKIPNVEAENVVFESDMHSIITVRKIAVHSDKIIFHSLFFSYIYFLAFTLVPPAMYKKYFWMIWGADLYNAYWERNTTIKRRIKEVFRRELIKRIPHVGYILGDYEFLKQHYVSNADFYLSSYTYDFFIPEEKNNHKEKQVLHIMIGNSATPECRYIEILNKLSRIDGLKAKISCILSYPKNERRYTNEVIDVGNRLFGDRFHAITEYCAFKEYMEFLNDIDVAIFNHNRQQALGNIAELLYLGKKVFINSDNACKGYFEDIGTTVFSTDEISLASLTERLDEASSKANRMKIERFFSDKSFADRWRKIFEST